MSEIESLRLVEQRWKKTRAERKGNERRRNMTYCTLRRSRPIGDAERMTELDWLKAR